MKKIFLVFLIFLLVPSILAFNINREFSDSTVKSGEEITIKLTINLVSSGDEVYVIREEIPEGIKVINSGDGSYRDGKMLWVVINDIKNINHTYTITGNQGIYSFEGVYSLNGQNETKIGGENSITIEENSQASSDAKQSNSGDSLDNPDSSEENAENINNAFNNQETELSEENIQKTTSDKNEESKNSKNVLKIVIIVIIIILIIAIIIIYYIRKNKKEKAPVLNTTNQ